MVKDGRFASVGFNNAITIESFMIKDGEVSWPSMKSAKDKFTKIVECTNEELKSEVEKAILAKAKNSKDRGGNYKDKNKSRYKKSRGDSDDDADGGKKKYNNKKKSKKQDSGDGEDE